MQEIIVRPTKHEHVEWTLRASDEGLELEGDDGRIVVPVAQMPERVVLADLRKPFLSVKSPGRGREAFFIDDADVPRLLAGIGPDASLRWLLKQGMRYFVPIGLFFLITAALPMTTGGGLDWLSLFLGAGLVVIALAARYRPQAWLFVLDALWLVVLSIDGLVGIILGANSPWWILLLVFLLFGARNDWRRYQRLRAASALSSAP